MEIKVRRSRNAVVSMVGRHLSSRKRSYLAAAAAAVLAAGFFGLGLSFQSNLQLRWRRSRVYWTNTLQRIEAARKATPGLLTLDIKYQDMMKLAFQREEALERRVLLRGPEDFVPAGIRHEGRTLRAKIRLKGDWVDHQESEKWSFRVRLRTGNTVFGLREFSIQHPRTRHFIHEWIYHELLRREGVLAPRYDFIRVKINGDDLGIFGIEEHFDKILVESRGRREGPILKFGEDLLWEERAELFPEIDASPRAYAHEKISPVEPFKSRRMLSDPLARSQFRKASSLLEGFRRGELSPAQVFDVRRMAAFMAVNVFAGASHAGIWHNLRFYYNPVVSRLEPIGFDGDAGEILKKIERPGESFLGKLLKDRDFYREYLRQLERVSHEDYLESFFAEVGPALREKLLILHLDYPGITAGREIYRANRDMIRRALAPPKSVHAFFQGVRNGRLRLEIANIQAIPVELEGLSLSGRIFYPVKETVLESTSVEGDPSYTSVEFVLPAGFPWQDAMASRMRLVFRLLGASQGREDAVFPWPYGNQRNLDKDITRRKPNAAQFPFLRVDRKAREIWFRRGTWTLKRDMVLPGGYTVYCGEGTRIRLANSASILSYSPIRFIGSERDPIVIESHQGGGQGLAVLNAGGRSKLKYVKFSGLTNPSGKDWSLTGAVTFYESPVDIEDSEFSRSRSEDALNVVRTEVSILRTLFIHSAGDAFDADFSSGTISKTVFRSSGNDAIDLSGSRMKIQDVRIEAAGDKGLSAGEMSHVIAFRLKIAHAVVGVASKDSSIVDLKQTSVTGARIGIAVYQKKPEFAAGMVRAVGSSVTGTTYPLIVEDRSILEIDGKRRPASPKSEQKILQAFK